MAENKVQFNLKNVHYAKLTETVSQGVTSYSYATPVAVPGAVSLTLDQQGDVSKFYADGIVYYQSAVNNGYGGDLEMARFPEQMLQDIWGFILHSTDKTLFESADAENAEFALLFQIDGDADEQYYVFYKCSGTRPAVASTTNTETKEPQTQSSTISAVPRADGAVMCRTTKDTTTTVKSGWFSSVYEQGTPTPDPEENPEET